MKIWLKELLCCPVCKGDLTLKSFEGSDKEIVNGVLTCDKCQKWYPIIDGLPRMLWGENRGEYLDFVSHYEHDISKYSFVSERSNRTTTKQEVKNTFTTIWDKFPEFGIDDPAKSKFYDKWMAQKLGLDSVNDLYSFISSKSLILEVGVGSGQKLKMMAEHTEGKVVGFDLGSGAEHAYQNTKDMPNVAVIQADLFELPLKRGIFDFIISDGVLHHTTDTKQAFLSIVPLLSKGGEIVIRVYKRSGPIREFCDDYIRAQTTKMSEEECWEFCKGITKFGEVIAKTKHEIEIPEEIPLLNFKKGKYNLQRFLYHNIFKCFYNEAFTFDENNLVNFDWYHPVDAHRHIEEEVYEWFVEAGLEEIQIFNPESGISARGKLM
jgi:uncharacterized protein YbaR (Trm112 family)/ubiquinone/menaquinone biosynthesis C-methylase UbiE